MSGNEWDANTDQNEEGQEAPLSHVDYGRAEESEPVAAEAPHSNEGPDGAEEPKPQAVSKKSRPLNLRTGGLKKLANVKRETRIGMATMLSFLILVTAFIVNRNRSHPKAETPSAKASGTPVAIKYQPEPEPTVVKAPEKSPGAESPPAQTPLEPGKNEGSQVNDPNPSAIVLASADGPPPGEKVEPPAPKTAPVEPPKAETPGSGATKPDKPLDPPVPKASEPKATEPVKAVVPEPPKSLEVPATQPAETKQTTTLPGGEPAPGLSPPSLAPPAELPPTANELLTPPGQPASPIPSAGLPSTDPKAPETPQSNPPTELPPAGVDAPPAVPGPASAPEATKPPEPKKEEPKKEEPKKEEPKQPEPKKEEPKKEDPASVPVPIPIPVAAPAAQPPSIAPPPASSPTTHAAPATLPDLPMTPAPLDQKGLNVTQPLPVEQPKPVESPKPPAGEEPKKPEPGELPAIAGTRSLPASEVLPSMEPATNKAPEPSSSPFPEASAPRQITSTPSPFDSTKVPTITSEPKSAMTPPEDMASKSVAAKAMPLGPGWTPLRKVGRSSFATHVDAEPLTAKPTIPDGPPPKQERSAKEDVEPVLHVVQRTENFWTISRLYYGSGRYYRALWSYNRSKVPNIAELFVGTTIKVPPPELLDRTLIDTPSLATSAPAVRQKSTESGRIAPSDSQVRTVPATRGKADLAPDLSLRQPVSRAAAEDVDPPTSLPTYRVRPNDTLRAIAKQTLGDAKRDREILELNRALIDDPRRLTPGQTLILPADAIVTTKVR